MFLHFSKRKNTKTTDKYCINSQYAKLLFLTGEETCWKTEKLYLRRSETFINTVNAENKHGDIVETSLN